MPLSTNIQFSILISFYFPCKIVYYTLHTGGQCTCDRNKDGRTNGRRRRGKQVNERELASMWKWKQNQRKLECKLKRRDTQKDRYKYKRNRNPKWMESQKVLYLKACSENKMNYIRIVKHFRAVFQTAYKCFPRKMFCFLENIIFHSFWTFPIGLLH